MKNVWRYIRYSCVLLALTAALAGLVLLGRQQEALRALIIHHADEESQRTAEISGAVTQLAAGLDAAAEGIHRDIASGAARTQGTLSRIQKSLSMPSVFAQERPDRPAVSASTAPGSSPPAGAETFAGERDLALARGLREGRKLFDAGRYHEAALTLAPFTSRQPYNPEVRLYHAASLFHANPGDSANHARIEKDLKDVVREIGSSLAASEALGSLYMEQGRWTEALEWLGPVADQQPDNARILEKAGACALRTGAVQKAAAWLDAAADLAPTDADLLYAAGSAHAAAEDFPRALERVQGCIDLQPRHVGARLLAGRCLFEAGRFAEAEEQLSIVLKDREDLVAAAYLGLCCRALGRDAEGTALLLRVKAAGRNPEAQALAERALGSEGE